MVTTRSVEVRLKADISDFNRGLAEASGSASLFASKLDTQLTKVNDRMGLLSSSIVALGPALVPVATAATVGFAALGTQLTFAAAGAAVAVGALKGVGDALKALDTYSGAPTQANLTALKAKLAELAPAGQSFVFFLDSLGPKLDQLRATAQQGFLPGLQAGIQSVMTQFPVVNQLTSQLATVMGDLAQEAGDAFKSPFWHGFLTDFARNASAALSTMGEGLGNIARGLAGMFEAFIPVGDTMSQKLLQLSQDFAKWGQSLSQNQGFQQFIQYTEQHVPEVLATLGSIVKALLGIARAAGPVGNATLPVIKALADGLAAIANSPAGPAIIGAAVAITSLAKALALLKAVGIVSGVSSAVGGVAAGAAGAEAAAAEGAAGATAARTGLLARIAGATTVSTGVVGAAAAATWVPIISGYGLASSAADKLSTAQKNLEQVTGSSVVSLQGQSEAIRELSSQVRSYYANQQKLSGWSWNPYTDVRTAAEFDAEHYGSGDSHAQAATATRRWAVRTQRQWMGIAQQLHQGFAGPAERVANPTVLQSALDQDLPILQQLGHTPQQVLQMGRTQGGAQELVDEIKAYNQAASLAAKPSAMLQSAIAGLDSKLVTGATSAQNMAAALSALTGPAMTNQQATDAYAAALQHLPDSLAKTTKSLTAQTDAGRQNRAAVDDMITKYEALQAAGAGVGESSKQFADSMQKQYYAMIHAGVAAGISRGDMIAYLATLGLTPKSVSTKVNLDGVSAARSELTGLQGQIDRMHGTTVRINVEQVGIRSGVQVTPSAYGNLLTFGTGGTLPPVGSQPPQMRNRSQGALLWNENPHSPWEAFISGDPSVKARSMGILEQAAGRIQPGSKVEWMAAGGMVGQRGGYTPGSGDSGGLVSAVNAVRAEVSRVRNALTALEVKVKNPSVFDARALGAGLLTADLTQAFGELMDSMDHV